MKFAGICFHFAECTSVPLPAATRIPRAGGEGELNPHS